MFYKLNLYKHNTSTESGENVYKIMIIEDDMTIANILNNHLSKWGFESFYVNKFDNIIEQFVAKEPQLVLLDITLPFYNGYYWCSEIRKISKVPIIFISSNSANIDIVMAINMGGDDFITKPFDLTIVVAKIQALLRRTYSFQGQTNILEHKGIILNLGEASLTYHNNKIELTKNDIRILQLLIENKGNTVSRDTIMKKLWDNDCFIDDNTLTVNVTRLRKRLKEASLINFIVTKKGLGYMVVD